MDKLHLGELCGGSDGVFVLGLYEIAVEMESQCGATKPEMIVIPRNAQSLEVSILSCDHKKCLHL